MKRRGPDILVTSVHEAGHAIYYRHLGLNVKRIVVGGNLRRGDTKYIWLGYIQLYRPESARRIDCLAAAVAGRVAENIIFGTRVPLVGADLREVNNQLNGMGAARRARLMRSARRLARRVLRAKLPALKHVAACLVIHGRINGTRRLDRIIKKAKL